MAVPDPPVPPKTYRHGDRWLTLVTVDKSFAFSREATVDEIAAAEAAARPATPAKPVGKAKAAPDSDPDL